MYVYNMVMPFTHGMIVSLLPIILSVCEVRQTCLWSHHGGTHVNANASPTPSVMLQGPQADGPVIYNGSVKQFQIAVDEILMILQIYNIFTM